MRDYTEFFATLGENIRKRRIMLGYTKLKLAAKSGISVQRISEYEKGTRNPSTYTVYALCEVFGCTIDELVKRCEK